MEWQGVTFDWNQARAFLVTAEEGSLSAAARSLCLTQPTLGRQVSALEEKLGVTLFDRVGKSLKLTKAGLDMLEHFRVMGEAATRISLAASGQSQLVEGHVTISATNMMAMHHLPPVLKKIRTIAPGIELDIVTSNEMSDLRRREADIAIRHARPEHPELTAKLVNETSAHLYASTDLLNRTGRATSAADLADAEFIGFENSERYLAFLTSIGLPLTRGNFKISTASGPLSVELIKQGMGIGMLPKEIAEKTPGIEQVLPDLTPIPIQTWIVAHRELHTSRRIRLVFDLLAESFKASEQPAEI